MLEYIHSDISNQWRTLPVNPTEWAADSQPTIQSLTDKSFIAILGHNIASYSLDNIDSFDNTISINEDCEYDGWSISSFSGTDLGQINLNAESLYQ